MRRDRRDRRDRPACGVTSSGSSGNRSAASLLQTHTARKALRDEGLQGEDAAPSPCYVSSVVAAEATLAIRHRRQNTACRCYRPAVAVAVGALREIALGPVAILESREVSGRVEEQRVAR